MSEKKTPSKYAIIRTMRGELQRLGMGYQLTARIVGFKVVVRVHGWRQSSKAQELKDFAQSQGFELELG